MATMMKTPTAKSSGTQSGLSRRAFIGTAGALVVTFSFAGRLLAQEKGKGPKLPGSLAKAPELDSWLRVEADGTVTIFTGKAELGQGIKTAIAQIAAEELDVPIARLRIVTADTAETPNEGYTAGSQSIQDSGGAVRQAAAEARAALVALAAERLGIAADRLETANGAVRVRGGTQTIGYGDLLGGKRLDRKAEGKVKPKEPSRYEIVGTSVPRFDIPAKVYGRPAYVQDIRLPGMIHGRVVHPPSYGATLASVDDAKIATLPGVLKVVRNGSFLGVIAEREEQAIRAADALKASAKWQESAALPDMKAMPAWLEANVDVVDRVVNGVPKEGPVPDAIARDGVDRVEATYTKSYTMHGSIGPSAAVAEMKDGGMTVWSHSQGVYPLRDTIALMLKIDKKNIRVIHTEGSGCYGHNAADDAGGDAAMLAAALPGRPVRVQWMRADEHGWEPYGSAMLLKASAGLTHDGRIAYWNYDLWSTSHGTRPRGRPPGNQLSAAWHMADPQPLPKAEVVKGRHSAEYRNSDPIYDVGDSRIVRHFSQEMPLRVSSTRSLGAYANVFAIESFMDELAAKAKIDPVVFRLNHLKDQRAKDVLLAATRTAGWRERTGPTKPGGARVRGQGVGFAQYKNEKCYACVVVDLEVDRGSGAVQLLRATIAGEAGQYINPNGIANQLEGGFVQSASWTLKEQVTFDRTRITSLDWAGYPILTFPEVPEVETHVINRSDLPSLGAGEASQGPSSAAIANAIFDAIGVRLRDLPLTPDKIKSAIG